jgi:hypothetical protein
MAAVFKVEANKIGKVAVYIEVGGKELSNG